MYECSAHGGESDGWCEGLLPYDGEMPERGQSDKQGRDIPDEVS